MFRTLLAGAAIAATLAMAPSLVAAQTINTLPFWDGADSVAPFGGSGNGSTGVYGQTFISPGTAITGFTFQIDNRDLDLNVVAQVYAWNGNLIGGNVPQGATGPALFTGSFLIAALKGFQAVHVDTGITALTQGSNYVILFADITDDSVESEWGIISGSHPVAFDGGFNFYNNNHTLASINSNPWSADYDRGSLAYVATFTSGAIPEPATWALMIGGFGMAGAVLRRRRVLALA